MLRGGLLEEVTELLLRDRLPPDFIGTKSIGYRQTIDYLARPDFLPADLAAFQLFLRYILPPPSSTELTRCPAVHSRPARATTPANSCSGTVATRPSCGCASTAAAPSTRGRHTSGWRRRSSTGSRSRGRCTTKPFVCSWRPNRCPRRSSKVSQPIPPSQLIVTYANLAAHKKKMSAAGVVAGPLTARGKSIGHRALELLYVNFAVQKWASGDSRTRRAPR